MKSSVILSILMCSSSLLSAQNNAQHSTFTPKQLAEHLKLKGGNWTASFDEKLFCGIIITETSNRGITKKRYKWSSDASKTHEFFFKHYISGSVSRRDLHDVSFSSTQVSEWTNSDGDSSNRSRTSLGSGSTYSLSLPSGIACEQSYQNNSMQLKPELPQLLYSWTSEEAKDRFIFEIVFAKDKAKAEEATSQKDQ